MIPASHLERLAVSITEPRCLVRTEEVPVAIGLHSLQHEKRTGGVNPQSTQIRVTANMQRPVETDKPYRMHGGRLLSITSPPYPYMPFKIRLKESTPPHEQRAVVCVESRSHVWRHPPQQPKSEIETREWRADSSWRTCTPECVTRRSVTPAEFAKSVSCHCCRFVSHLACS